jgi:hypothetical protein
VVDVSAAIIPDNLLDVTQQIGATDQGAQTRRGPTSVSEMEVSLADMYNGHSIDVCARHSLSCSRAHRIASVHG